MSEETNIPAFPEGTTQEEIEQVRRLMNAEFSSADTELFRIRLRATRGDLAAKRIVEIEAALIAIKVKAAGVTRGFEASPGVLCPRCAYEVTMRFVERIACAVCEPCRIYWVCGEVIASEEPPANQAFIDAVDYQEIENPHLHEGED